MHVFEEVFFFVSRLFVCVGSCVIVPVCVLCVCVIYVFVFVMLCV